MKKENPVIIFDEDGLIYGIGESLKKAVKDLRQWGITVGVGDIAYNNSKSTQAPKGKLVYDYCTSNLSTCVFYYGRDIGFRINENDLADVI